jgi:hypothetical protein
MANRCLYAFLVLLAIGGQLAGCATQIHSSAQHSDLSLKKGELETRGLAFITPSTVTGQEEDRQTLAFIFAEVIKDDRPDIPVITLPETLSDINTNGLAVDYKNMYDDYVDTGIFKREILALVGEVTDARYLVQLKLADFSQKSKGRFSFLGLRILQTQEANIRLFCQIWDSVNGSIVWESTEEVNYAWDSATEKPVTFRIIVEETARNLVSRLP